MNASIKSQKTTIQIALENAAQFIAPINPFLYWTDSYKLSHILFETEGVKEIYSNFTPRFDKYLRAMLGKHYDGQVVVFGIQWLIIRLHHMAQKGFFARPKEEAIAEMKAVLGPYIQQEKFDQFEKLHDLGYLPIQIKALDEGTLVPIGTPFFTIRNTHPEFEWLPNFLETGISMDLWKQLTVATIARTYRLISSRFANETIGDDAMIEFQNHDFSSRGQSGFESCAINGVAFLLSSCGTDNVASLWAAKAFYGSENDDRLLAASVPAGEHSVTTSGILTEQERMELHPTMPDVISLEEAEFMYAKKLLTERFPTGIVSYVADSYDYWTFVTRILPQLKDVIMQRDGKFVVRGDSGDPVHIIAGYRIKHISSEACGGYGGDGSTFNALAKQAQLDGFEVVSDDDGRFYKILGESLSGQGLIEMSRAEAVGTIETLYEIFGGITNAKGYVELDSHIGMIYGDGITLARSENILERLKEKGFASTNIVFGVGSYSLNMISRDHLGMAIKATNTIVDIHGNDVDKPIYKDPKTDTSKKSAKGLMKVFEEDGKIKFIDNVSRDQEDQGLLTVVYKDGQLHKFDTVYDIRNRIWK